MGSIWIHPSSGGFPFHTVPLLQVSRTTTPISHGNGAHACETGVPTGVVLMKSESWGPSVLSYLFQKLNSRLSEGFISLM